MLPIIALCFLSARSIFASADELLAPKIIFNRVSNSWQNLTKDEFSKPVFYSNGFGGDLVLECVASYPIRWNIYGYLAPLDLLKFREPTRNFRENKFSIFMNAYFVGGKYFPESGASCRIACEKFDQPDIADSLHTFVQGNSTSPFIPQNTKFIQESKRIPCTTKNPSSIPNLYIRKENGTEKFFENPLMRYDAVDGFVSNEVFVGSFVCRLGNYSQSFTAVTASNQRGVYLKPINSSVRRFTDETIILECGLLESNNSVEILIEDSEDFNVVTEMSNNRKAVTEIKSQVPRNGTAVCITKSNGIRTVLKEWSFEFIQSPELFIDNYSGEAHCLSKEKYTTAIQAIKCDHSNSCPLITKCLGNPNICNIPNYFYLHSNKSIYCLVDKYDVITSNCVSIEFTFQNGLVECSERGLARNWQIFTSLGFKRYINWRDAPINEIIRMDPTKCLISHTESARFYCMATTFLFADSLRFELEYVNGTIVPLVTNSETMSVTNPGKEDNRRILGLNIVGVLDIKLPEDAIAVHCVAPWWNDTSVIRTSRHFKVYSSLSSQLDHTPPACLKNDFVIPFEENRE